MSDKQTEQKLFDYIDSIKNHIRNFKNLSKIQIEFIKKSDDKIKNEFIDELIDVNNSSIENLHIFFSINKN
jgi:ADP-dependent phosphofructokinase/glucokinase